MASLSVKRLCLFGFATRQDLGISCRLEVPYANAVAGLFD